jgi:basic amino acid/polyamine antiporter, APA family
MSRGTRLRKDLTWWDLMVFGVSVVVGAGIFTITASTAGNVTGPAISVSFVIAGWSRCCRSRRSSPACG